MSHYTIHCLDHPGALEVRLAQYDAHRAYLGGPLGVRILVSGPLLDGDGGTAVGSFFLLEAPDRAAVDAFHDADPFKAAGIWRECRIHAFSKRQDNR